MKDISKIIKEFENVFDEGYVQKMNNNEPTESSFYLSRQIAKYMMRADALNFHADLVRTEMTGTQHITISHV